LKLYCLDRNHQSATPRVRRDRINGGVRFSSVDCPNALAWTVTTGLPQHPGQLVIHCTINRRGHEPDFIDAIELFLDAWALRALRGLCRAPEPLLIPAAPSRPVCAIDA